MGGLMSSKPRRAGRRGRRRAAKSRRRRHRYFDRTVSGDDRNTGGARAPRTLGSRPAHRPGMLDVQVACLANQAMNYLISGSAPRRSGNAHSEPGSLPRRLVSDQRRLRAHASACCRSQRCPVPGRALILGGSAREKALLTSNQQRRGQCKPRTSSTIDATARRRLCPRNSLRRCGRRAQWNGASCPGHWASAGRPALGTGVVPPVARRGQPPRW